MRSVAAVSFRVRVRPSVRVSMRRLAFEVENLIFIQTLAVTLTDRQRERGGERELERERKQMHTLRGARSLKCRQ